MNIDKDKELLASSLLISEERRDEIVDIVRNATLTGEKASVVMQKIASQVEKTNELAYAMYRLGRVVQPPCQLFRVAISSTPEHRTN